MHKLLARTTMMAVVASLATACATTTTQMGSVAPDAVAREQEHQREFALRSEFAQQARVEDVGEDLLRSAVQLCGGDVTSRLGISAATASEFKRDWRNAARSLGFSDTVTIAHVAKGSSADRAGLRNGDQILSVNGHAIPSGADAATELHQRFKEHDTSGVTESVATVESRRIVSTTGWSRTNAVTAFKSSRRTSSMPGQMARQSPSHRRCCASCPTTTSWPR